MTFNIQKNILLNRTNNKPILLDAFLPDTTKPSQTILYCHGFKGFKDWGPNEQMASYFAERNFAFIKFNFSHNGGTPKQPIDFPDPEAFGNNNISKELDDIDSVLDWLKTQKQFNTLSVETPLTIMGHSRGSATAIIKANEDNRIDKVISIAGVSDFQARFIDEETLRFWKENGVIYIENSRTKQQLPLYYQIAEDIYGNADRLNVEKASKELDKPHLIIHGTDDPTVPVEEALSVHKWSKKSQLKIIEGADHVFNVKHPWEESKLPADYNQMLDSCFNFLIESK